MIARLLGFALLQRFVVLRSVRRQGNKRPRPRIWVSTKT